MEIPVHLTAVASQTEADIICSLLRENGIKCGDRAADVAIQGIGGSGGWREILVSEDDLEAAQELLPTPPPVE
jgi:putative signal transducing protein